MQLGVDPDATNTEAFSQASSSQAARSISGQVIVWSGLGLAVSSLSILAVDFANVYRKSQAKTTNVTSNKVAGESVPSAITPEDTTTSTDSAASMSPINTTSSYTAPSTTTYVSPMSSGS